jgi:hypothetical protein
MVRRPSYKPNRQRIDSLRLRALAAIVIDSGRSWDAGCGGLPADRVSPDTTPINRFGSQHSRSLNTQGAVASAKTITII